MKSEVKLKTTTEIEGVQIYTGMTSEIIGALKAEDPALHEAPKGLTEEGSRILSFIRETSRHLTARTKHVGITLVTAEAIHAYMDLLRKPPEEGGYGSLRAAANAFYAMPRGNGNGNGNGQASATANKLFVDMVLAGNAIGRAEPTPKDVAGIGTGPAAAVVAPA